MEGTQRANLIRKGNQAFNEGKIPQAAEIFKAVNYKDGLIRVGDYYYFDQRKPLMAYGYYKRANHNIMLEKISDGFIFALKYWLSSDSKTPDKTKEKSPGN